MARKKSLAVSVVCMAIYCPTPGFEGRTFKLCVLIRWDFIFCVRGERKKKKTKNQNTQKVFKKKSDSTKQRATTKDAFLDVNMVRFAVCLFQQLCLLDSD